MNNRPKPAKWMITLGLVLVAGLVAGSLATAPARADDDDEHEQEELHEAMEAMGELMSKMRRTLRKPEQNAESLKMVRKMQELTVECMEGVPEIIAKQPEAEQAKLVLVYKRKMAAVYVAQLDLEEALMGGDNEKAGKIYKALATHKKEGHDQFVEEEEDDD